MSTTNVVEIAPGASPKKPRQRRLGNRPFEDQIAEQLWEYEESVREAEAVATLLRAKFLDMPADRVTRQDLDILLRGLGGIRSILRDVRGLADPAYLIQQLEDRRARDI